MRKKKLHIKDGTYGWEGLAANVEPVKLTVLRSSSDPANLPRYSVFLGYPVIGLWYWCADQSIVQRVLGAKDKNRAYVGPLFCRFLTILLFVTMVALYTIFSAETMERFFGLIK
jgi:uncharacterized sodium:solute symporter family permease YidK